MFLVVLLKACRPGPAAASVSCMISGVRPVMRSGHLLSDRLQMSAHLDFALLISSRKSDAVFFLWSSLLRFQISAPYVTFGVMLWIFSSMYVGQAECSGQLLRFVRHLFLYFELYQ